MGFSSSKQQSANTSQQTSVSQNQAYPFLQGALGGEVSNAGQSSNVIRSLLGMGGDGGQAGLDNYLKSSNYNFARDEGIRGLTANKAASGMTNSGSAIKGAVKYSSNLASSYLDKYLGNLFNLQNSGIQAGQVLSAAGNTANSQGTSFGNSKGSSMSLSTG